MQRFRQWFLWLPLVVLLAVSIYLFVQQIVLGIPQGTTPAPDWVLWTLAPLMLLATIALAILRLQTEVHEGGLHVTFWPMRKRIYGWDEITRFESVTYRPLREYGGWGYRIAGRGNRAVSTSGNRGVRLHGTNEENGRVWSMLIGSQQPDAFYKAMTIYHSKGAS